MQERRDEFRIEAGIAVDPVLRRQEGAVKSATDHPLRPEEPGRDTITPQFSFPFI